MNGLNTLLLIDFPTAQAPAQPPDPSGYALALLVGLAVLGFGSLSTRPTMILSAVRIGAEWVSRYQELQWFRKIVFACPYCMANPLTWGGIAYLIAAYWGLLPWDVPTWLIFCVVLSGTRYLLDELLDAIATINE